MTNDTLTIVSTSDTPEQIQAALTGEPVPDASASPTPESPASAAAEQTPPAPPADATPPRSESQAGDDATPPANETPEQRAERELKSRRERRIAKIQSQIDEIVRRREEESRAYELAKAQREAEEARLQAARAELARLQAGGDPDATPAPATSKPVASKDPSTPQAQATTDDLTTFDEPMPKVDEVDEQGNPKFPNYDDWVAALADWSARKARFEARAEFERAERARIERETAINANREAIEAYHERLEEFKRTVAPDFDAAVEQATPDVALIRQELGPRSLDVIDRYTTHDAENGPAIVYYLLKHTDEMERIAKLPVPLQLVELGKLDARLGIEARTTSRQDDASPSGSPSVVTPRTPVPEPIQPVGGGTKAPVPLNLDALPYREYKRIRDQQEREARR